MIETRYRSLKKIHRTGVAVLHCPGCVLTTNLRCLDIFTSIRLWLLPISGVAKNLGSSSLLNSFAGGVAKNLGSSSLLNSFAGGETCNWRCFTVNWTTLHTTGLADMAQATPSHGPGLQLSPCGNWEYTRMHVSCKLVFFSWNLWWVIVNNKVKFTDRMANRQTGR